MKGRKKRKWREERKEERRKEERRGAKATDHETRAMKGREQDRVTAHTAQRTQHGQRNGRTNITWLSYLQAVFMSVNGFYYYSYHHCIIIS